ncbi:hypothetical protein [Rufibacter hautae]|uniref:Uncharacterized protein n=1 Tax=Rufibacter hautae TaxID=2595005 RepID=A0A5B6TB48_9BACT|nr:hypothetical protein [Rufibacter hautae]KAA3437107.1 hypothetical protein FOA19_22335 [Rufibacter hautae]
MGKNLEQLQGVQRTLEQVRDQGQVSLSTVQELISRALEEISAAEAGRHHHPLFLRAEKGLREAREKALGHYTEDAAHAAITVFLYEKGAL